jgi:hypothetical protein
MPPYYLGQNDRLQLAFYRPWIDEVLANKLPDKEIPITQFTLKIYLNTVSHVRDTVKVTFAHPKTGEKIEPFFVVFEPEEFCVTTEYSVQGYLPDIGVNSFTEEGHKVNSFAIFNWGD